MSHYQKWVTCSPITGIKKWDRDKWLRAVMIHPWELGTFYPKQMYSQGKRVSGYLKTSRRSCHIHRLSWQVYSRLSPKVLYPTNARYRVWFQLNKHLSITFYLPVSTQTLQLKQQIELILFLPSGSPLYNGRWRPLNRLLQSNMMCFLMGKVLTHMG